MEFSDPTAAFYSRNTAQYTAQHSHKGRGAGPLRIIGRILLVLIIIVLLCAAAIFGGLFAVKSSADTLTDSAKQLASDIADSDTDGMRTDIDNINNSIATLQTLTNNPLWEFAGNAVPVYGSDMKAVAEVVDIADELNTQLVQPVAGALEECPMNMLLDGGNVNLKALNTICESVLNARPAVADASARIEAINGLHIAKIINAVNTVRNPIRTASALLDENAGLIEILPQLFGSQGSRTYLVVAQNNGELRPVGGMPGTYVPVTVDNGQISFGEPTSATELRSKTDDYNIPITKEENAIYTHNLGDVASDFNRSADFSRDGEIMAAGWKKYYGDDAQVDGIIGMDVVMFQRLIELAADQVTLEDGTVVQSSQLATLILHDVCWSFIHDSDFMAEMDAYDEAVLSSSLAVFRSNIGQVDLEALFDTLVTGFHECRLNVWLANEDEESAFDKLDATGKLYTSEEEPTLGVYFFDYTYSKMGWYFHTETNINNSWTNDDGTTSYSVTTTITNNITNEEAKEATSYITGESSHKLKVSDMITCVYLYAPFGGTITDLSRSGGTWQKETMVDDGTYRAGMQTKRHDDFEVTYGVVHLLAGETTSITYTVTTSAAATEELAIHTTPTVN